MRNILLKVEMLVLSKIGIKQSMHTDFLDTEDSENYQIVSGYINAQEITSIEPSIVHEGFVMVTLSGKDDFVIKCSSVEMFQSKVENFLNGFGQYFN